VEVPSCEGRAKDFALLIGLGRATSENRIDQRMPLEPVTDSLLPSKVSVRSDRVEHCSVARRRKTHGNVCAKAAAVMGLRESILGPPQMEGLLEKMVDRHSEGTPRRVFLFLVAGA